MKKALPSHCVVQDANDGRAKDGESKLAMSERLVRVEPVVGGRAARPEPLAAACPLGRDSLCPGAADRDDMAPRGPGQGRLPGLFLLPRGTRTQDQIRCHAVA